MVWGAWSLQHRHRVTSEDGREPELYIQGKDSSVPAGQSWLTACQQQRQTSTAGQHRTDGWGRAEQAGVGMGEPNAVATLTSSLLPTFLPGPASKASLPVIAYYFSPEDRLPSHPPVQPMMLLSPNRAMLSPFWGLLCCPKWAVACFTLAWSQPCYQVNSYQAKWVNLKRRIPSYSLQFLQGFPASISIHSHLNTHRAPNYILSSLIYSEWGNMMTAVQCSITS